MLIAVLDLRTAAADRAIALAKLDSERDEIRAMPGNLDFRVYAGRENDEAVAVIHEWADEPSFAAYLASAAFARSGAVLRPLVTSPPVSRRFRAALLETVWPQPAQGERVRGSPVRREAFAFAREFAAAAPSELSVDRHYLLCASQGALRLLAEDARFEDVARDVGLAPRSLARRFENECGMTWSAVVRRMRVLRAIEELAASEDSVTTIAHAVGDTSLSAFNAAFRDLTGRTPTQYRTTFRP